ncbi:unnamed protein product [Protopolystoma xenopodis]|uniref:Uncharacterized protein n=1 Tax=Protopolystoma xenopodis TaxID=117903 RepID=A0A3S5A6C0_9PLAT|nr:unnamed protein product [Protopolystoma xenopodis]
MPVYPFVFLSPFAFSLNVEKAAGVGGEWVGGMGGGLVGTRTGGTDKKQGVKLVSSRGRYHAMPVSRLV